MRRRILMAIMATTTLAVALFGIPLAIAISDGESSKAAAALERDATIAAGAIGPGYAAARDPVELPRRPDTVLGLYDLRGRKVAGEGPSRGDGLILSALGNRVASAEVGESLVAAAPITSQERVIGAIRSQRSLRTVDAKVTRLIVGLAMTGLVVLCLAYVVGLFLASRISRHVRAVRDDAVRLGDGNFAVAGRSTGIVELDDVVAALRTTASRLARTIERERAFSVDASHQLRTPLTGLRLILDNELTAPRPDSSDALNEALQQVDRLDTTIDDLLRLARPTDTPPPPLDVVELIGSVEHRWRTALSARSRPLRCSNTVHGSPHARAAAIGEALDVLIDNAMRYATGAVTVAASDIAHGIAITVSDEGPGIDPAIALDRIFQRDSKAHAQTGRTGIGLALARTLVEGEGGRLVLEQSAPAAHFTIFLPVNSREGG